MSKKRKTYSPGFRAKVALAAHRGDKTIHELAAQFQVSPQQISNWKARLLEHVEDIFQDNRSRKKDEPTNESELFEQIGRLKMEVDWLKKICVTRRLTDDHGLIPNTRNCPYGNNANYSESTVRPCTWNLKVKAKRIWNSCGKSYLAQQPRC